MSAYAATLTRSPWLHPGHTVVGISPGTGVMGSSTHSHGVLLLLHLLGQGCLGGPKGQPHEASGVSPAGQPTQFSHMGNTPGGKGGF